MEPRMKECVLSYLRTFSSLDPVLRSSYPLLFFFFLLSRWRAQLEMKEWVRSGDFEVLCTSFEIANMERSSIRRWEWEYIVVDEAHRLKNETSTLSQVLRQFRSKHRLLLTVSQSFRFSLFFSVLFCDMPSSTHSSIHPSLEMIHFRLFSLFLRCLSLSSTGNSAAEQSPRTLGSSEFPPSTDLFGFRRIRRDLPTERER